MLNAGKHILCEKVVTSSAKLFLDQCDKMWQFCAIWVLRLRSGQFFEGPNFSALLGRFLKLAINVVNGLKTEKTANVVGPMLLSFNDITVTNVSSKGQPLKAFRKTSRICPAPGPSL